MSCRRSPVTAFYGLTSGMYVALLDVASSHVHHPVVEAVLRRSVTGAYRQVILMDRHAAGPLDGLWSAVAAGAGFDALNTSPHPGQSGSSKPLPRPPGAAGRLALTFLELPSHAACDRCLAA